VLSRQSWLEQRICGFACPNRWELQGILLGFLLLWGAAWMLSNWVPRIRRGLERPWVAAFKVLLLLTFVTSLWCDPYWRERRPLILLLVLGGLLLSSVLARFRKRSEAE
jgi:protein-S-isoprenylcysteine O-methyltransferase Ste14